jgi:protein CpxP
MKKQLFLGAFAVMVAGGAMAQATGSVQAQTPSSPQGMQQQKTPAERTKETLLKLQDALPFTGDQGAKSYPIFFDFYTAQQKAMEDMRASGTMDRDAMKATRDKLAAERDAKLAVIFTPDQMKKWTNEIEPSLRPQRGGQKQ